MIKKAKMTSVFCLFWMTAAPVWAAAGPLLLKPNTPWKVVSVSEHNVQELRLCTMMREFEGGDILYLSGNSAGISHISVALKDGNGLKVGEDVPLYYGFEGMKAQNVQARVLGNGVVSALGRAGEALNTTLKGTPRISIRIGQDQAKIYDLWGVGAALARFENCVGNRQKPQVKKKPALDLKKTVSIRPESIRAFTRAPPPPVVRYVLRENKQDQKTSTRPAPSDAPRYTETLAQEWAGQDKILVPVNKREPAKQRLYFPEFIGIKTALVRE